MSTVHTLNKTAQNSLLNEKLSNAINQGDDVILIEDGVYQCLALFSGSRGNAEIKSWPQQTKRIYALKDDALARGITIDIEGISFISYEEFVQLSLNCNKVVSWY